MNVVILAAGKGTRMCSGLPKVLHPVGGMPMLGHVLRTAQALNPKKIIVVIGHGADQVKAVIQALPEISKGVPIDWVIQDPPQGTGHAVAQALPKLDPQSTALILYGDVPLIRSQTLRQLVDTAEKNRSLAVLTAMLDSPTGYGRIVRDGHQHIQGIVEEKDADAAIRAICEINTGFMAAPAEHLAAWVSAIDNRNAQKEFYLTDIIAKSVAEGKAVHSLRSDHIEEILGVNSQEDRAQIERIYQRRIAEQLMSAGVRLQDPERIDVLGQLECASDVSISVGCIFEGRVQIAAGAVIGPHCVIRNAQIGQETVIEAFSHIDGAAIGPRSVIGPYARLRPGTELAEGVHIGNFVEVKNSVLGPRSKANHLSYLGDASIGSRVNVGAGTITCNYDGAEKHRTTIEDDVFIGSDTQLVAPVTVGRGATLGAGTTLTQDAPEDALTISRAQQVTIKNYRRPQKKEH
ncbi:MAG: bifunctional UDP-N-acetylglucosamine diphosphorylase/glucosamine-1-phosphate N-acetyltransferase GlmU [Betaproteobacteria bacterium]|jgi:bifunctional UDP-N-acetylglucosamine pyrophosphorylase/glucosamine-1-phosphate N-acetyltransferase|nr:bifunctional UDP-N-acetylglucosamine diphosphorylase/glucosamine-1-phosphate N-acetyltransferase GlmU [Betaproteobacteria bacterium]